MEAKALDFLKRLSESFGPSEFEAEPVRTVKQYVQPFADEIRNDRLGTGGPVVILPDHVRRLPHSQSGLERAHHPHCGGIKDFLPALPDEGRRDRWGAIHQANAGCPAVVLAVPTRHVHSHVGMLSLEDVDNAVSLVTEVVRRLDARTVESFTSV